MTADKGVQTFTYSFYFWNGSLAESDVVPEAYDLNVPARPWSGRGGEPPLALQRRSPQHHHRGGQAGRGWLGRCDRAPVRGQAYGDALRADHLPAGPRACQTNMLEEYEADLPCRIGKIALEFRPFEIKTVRLSR